MKRTLLLLTAVLLVACADTSGLSKESSRPPRGNPNAAVLVEEFADLQCPACRAAHTKVAVPIHEKYGDRIRFEFQHFPIRQIHRYALDAAEAAECAADQGKFWEFVDLDFEKQDDLDFDALLVWAEELGLDVELFERCWKSHVKKDIVLAGYKEGRDRGVTGTPSFFVQGRKVETGFDTISEAIDEALKGTTMPL